MLMFCDSFDPYIDFLIKWSSGSANFNSNPSFVRTGTQSLHPTNTGFLNLPRINFANRITVVSGVAYYAAALGNQISFGYNQSAGLGFGEIDVASDGSLIFRAAGNPITAQTPPGVISAAKYYYIEMKASFQDFGAYEIRVNGATVLSGNFTNIFGSQTGLDSYILVGSSNTDVYYDDFYLLDGSGAVNNDFLGAVRIYAILPDANETPLQWTPLAGTNFSEVNTAPPPGDSSYVFDNAAGDIDQYHYTITGPVGAYTIHGMQHSLDCRLDAAGSHTVRSQINSHTGPSPTIGNDTPGSQYQYIITPWDVNPNTGLPFAPADFATTWVGPKITA